MVDTPGILDHSLVERNTIEMQAITALAHLRAAILYVMDISEQCGRTIEQQVDLFNNIKPLFVNKPLLVALNKVDVTSPQELREDAKQLLAQFEKDDIPIIPMSTLTDEGVVEVKTRACDELLAQRVELKLKGKKMPDILNRLHLAVPKPRDVVERPPWIPPGAKIKTSSVSTVSAMELDQEVEPQNKSAHTASTKKKLERDIKLEMGDDYFLDLKKNYLLPNEEEKYDIIPEIFEGKNVADYIDPDIMRRLDELEREEETRMAAGIYESEPEDPEVLATRKMAVAVRRKKVLLRKQSWDKRTRNYPIMPRGVSGRASRKVRGAEGMEVVMEGDESDMDGSGSMQNTKNDSFIFCYFFVCYCYCFCLILVPKLAGKKRLRSISRSGSAIGSRMRSVSRTPRLV